MHQPVSDYTAQSSTRTAHHARCKYNRPVGDDLPSVATRSCSCIPNPWTWWFWRVSVFPASLLTRVRFRIYLQFRALARGCCVHNFPGRTVGSQAQTNCSPLELCRYTPCPVPGLQSQRRPRNPERRHHHRARCRTLPAGWLCWPRRSARSGHTRCRGHSQATQAGIRVHPMESGPEHQYPIRSFRLKYILSCELSTSGCTS